MFVMTNTVDHEVLPSVNGTVAPRLTCRRIVEPDIEGAVDLLATGFPERTRDYWRRGLERLRGRIVPDGFPRYGYVLADGDRLVGIVLTILSTSDAGTVRGNVSSWYVDPAYRGFSNLLLSAPLKLRDVTFLNISPASETIDTIRVQGFTPYASGSFQALAAFAPRVPGARIRRVSAADGPGLLADHAACGCLSFEVLIGSETHPFVFQPNHFIVGKVPCAQLIYCRTIEDVARFAGPIGRHLLRYGLFAVLIDVDAPLRGVPGLYRPGRVRRYYRGTSPPRLGDLSATELVFFGP